MTAEKPESPETTSSPDYSITRRVGYAHTLKTAPAFTFGRRNERVIGRCLDAALELRCGTTPAQPPATWKRIHRCY